MLKSDNVRGAGVSVALNLKEVIEIGRLVGLKSFVGCRDNLILNSLFNFEPMERFENWSDVRKFWSFGNSPSCRNQNELEAIELRLGKIQKQRVAVVIIDSSYIIDSSLHSPQNTKFNGYPH